MIDERALVDDFEATATALATKLVSATEVGAARDAVVAVRASRRSAEHLRSESNRVSQEIAATSSSGQKPPQEIADESKTIKNESAGAEEELRIAEERARDLLLRLPNLPSPDAPVGQSEDDNVVVEVLNFNESAYVSQTTPHWEIGERMGILDQRRSAKISGSMFSVLRADGAKLLHALVAFARALHADKNEEVAPPHMVRTDTFTATGHLPKFEEDAYRLRDDDLWMIPTGEVPLMSMHRDEVLGAGELPRRYMAYTVCFRREAGSAGRDTRGLLRLHEFHKVELVRLCAEEQVQSEFEALLMDARRTLDTLELPYRLVDLCTADLTFASERIIDLEVWAPGAEQWLEVSSVGVFGNFQTRRANIRYRPEGGGKTAFAHALNGTAMATPRVWAALVEHGYDESSNSVKLPKSLVPYFGADLMRANVR